jgi:hypothetical protein
MPAWFSKIVEGLSGKKPDIEVIKKAIAKADPKQPVAVEDLSAYARDIEKRAKAMNHELAEIYAKYGVTFSGFKSFDQACSAMKAITKKGSAEAYNNLIKAESAITGEMRRHLSLIRMAVLQDGSRVIAKINSDPKMIEKFNEIFGQRNVVTGQNTDGVYQRLWSEVHRLAEYLIIKKDKVLH